MRQERGTREHRCSKCGKVFSSAMRLQHHRAAEHAARTSEDIARTSLRVPKTRDKVPKIHGTPSGR